MYHSPFVVEHLINDRRAGLLADAAAHRRTVDAPRPPRRAVTGRSRRGWAIRWPWRRPRVTRRQASAAAR